MPEAMAGTAIFALDRTLTRSGTWSRYMFSVNRGRPSFYLRLPFLLLHAIAYKIGLFSRQSVKEHGLKTLAWAQKEDLETAAYRFAEQEFEHGLRHQTQHVLEKHRARGDRLVMATAAAELVAKPMAELLGMDVLICTELDWSPDGRLTGKLAGPNCYGQAKLDLILAANAKHSFAAPMTGYSDHVSDLPFLQWVDEGVAVNPSRGLARFAAKAGIRIEDWDSDNMGSENT